MTCKAETFVFASDKENAWMPVAVDESLDIPLPGNVLQMTGTRLLPPAARSRLTAPTSAECCGEPPQARLVTDVSRSAMPWNQ
jgi:hypothetical protein